MSDEPRCAVCGFREDSPMFHDGRYSGPLHPTAHAFVAESDRALLAEVAASYVEHDDARMDYVVVQIDRDVWDRLETHRG